MQNSIDAIAFLQEELASDTVPNFLTSPWRRKIAWRILGLKLWRLHQLTFSEALQNFLPAARQSAEIGDAINTFISQELGKIFSRRGVYEPGKVMIFGQPFFPPPENSTRQSWRAGFEMIFQSVVKDQYHARKFLKSDSIIIDAGANAGVFSLWASHLAPQGTIYAFEPSTVTHQVLLKNIKPYANIHPVQSGLGQVAGEQTLFLDEGNTGSHTLADSTRGQAHSHAGWRNETVKIEQLDEFVKTHNLPRVDFIKIDTEGSEANILRGARETIKRFSPVIAMSAYHHPNDRIELPALLKSIDPGYVCRLHKDAEEDFICVKQ